MVVSSFLQMWVGKATEALPRRKPWVGSWEEDEADSLAHSWVGPPWLVDTLLAVQKAFVAVVAAVVVKRLGAFERKADLDDSPGRRPDFASYC